MPPWLDLNTPENGMRLFFRLIRTSSSSLECHAIGRPRSGAKSTHTTLQRLPGNGTNTRRVRPACEIPSMYFRCGPGMADVEGEGGLIAQIAARLTLDTGGHCRDMMIAGHRRRSPGSAERDFPPVVRTCKSVLIRSARIDRAGFVVEAEPDWTIRQRVLPMPTISARFCDVVAKLHRGRFRWHERSLHFRRADQSAGIVYQTHRLSSGGGLVADSETRLPGVAVKARPSRRATPWCGCRHRAARRATSAVRAPALGNSQRQPPILPGRRPSMATS